MGIILPITDSDTIRFWKFVKKSDSCWNWISSTWRGYGIFKIGNKTQKTHRVSWMIHYGPIPDGLFCLHHCDNRKCVRPDHLFLGTAKDNTHDAMNKGRFAIGENSPW